VKIYTKTGDKGETSLLSGSRVIKSDQRIESYGTIDELNSYLGLVRDYLEDESKKGVLLTVQEYLFTVGSHLADDGKRDFGLPPLTAEHITHLEQEIDEMNQHLEPMKNFILPGGAPAISYIHIARTICRRAERRVVELNSMENRFDLVVRYLNRLSDFLFVLARWEHAQSGVSEIPWKPAKS
jgi:cob(I)alamin adenosyltransferase